MTNSPLAPLGLAYPSLTFNNIANSISASYSIVASHTSPSTAECGSCVSYYLNVNQTVVGETTDGIARNRRVFICINNQSKKYKFSISHGFFVFSDHFLFQFPVSRRVLKSHMYVLQYPFPLPQHDRRLVQ